jgi:ATP-dependent protease ClpP protease subunit
MNIRNSTSKEATIDIEGYIGENWWEDKDKQNTLERIKKDINAIKGIGADTIIVNIHSPGGNIDHALAIHDALREHSAKIITKITGMCASAATIIMMAGDERKMSENALILIHKCWSFVVGNENDIEAELQTQRTVNDRILNIYLAGGKASKEELKNLMNENNGYGKYINSTESLSFGLITESYIPAGNQKVAAISKEIFNKMHLPKLPQGFESLIKEEETQDKKLWENIKIELKNLFSTNQHNNQLPNNEINMKNTFPLIVTLFAMADNTQYDKDKGVTFNNEQLKNLELKLAEITALQTEKTNLEAQVSEKDTKIASLQAIVDKVPANPQVNGSDAKDDDEETFEDSIKNDPYYQNLSQKYGIPL